jgi:hypothetical protein
MLFYLAAQSEPWIVEVCIVPADKILTTMHLDKITVDIYLGADADKTAMLL